MMNRLQILSSVNRPEARIQQQSCPACTTPRPEDPTEAKERNKVQCFAQRNTY